MSPYASSSCANSELEARDDAVTAPEEAIAWILTATVDIDGLGYYI